MVEWGGLENRCTLLGYRGFESLPLRGVFLEVQGACPPEMVIRHQEGGRVLFGRTKRHGQPDSGPATFLGARRFDPVGPNRWDIHGGIPR